MSKEIKLGNRVRETTTGFVGIATSKVEFLNGCVQYAVTPQIDKEGKRQEAYYVDVQSLEYVDEGVNVKPKGTGGPTTKVPSCRVR